MPNHTPIVALADPADILPEQTEPSLWDIVNEIVDQRLRERGVLPEVEDED